MRYIQHHYLFQILAARGFTAPERMLLVYMAGYAGKDGRCWPSIDTLATDTELSPRSVQRHLRALEDKKAITVTPTENGRSHANTYTISLPEITLKTVGGSGGDKLTGRGDKSDTQGVTNCHPKELKRKNQRGDDGFGMEGTGNTPPSRQGLKLARLLYQTLKTMELTKVVKPNKEAWARPVDKLIADGMTATTITAVLAWYAKNGRDRYAPKVRDAVEFRAKFRAILDKIERDTGEDATAGVPEISSGVRVVLETLTMTHWPPAIAAVLPVLAQRSYDNINALAAATNDILADLDEDDRIARFIIDHKAALFGKGQTPLLRWMTALHDRGVDHIKPADMIFSLHHPEYQKKGAECSIMYSGKAKLWASVMELHQ